MNNNDGSGGGVELEENRYPGGSIILH